MQTLLLIAIGSAIVNNVVLSQFLGICPFLGVSKKTETAAGMGGAVIFVITISSFVTSLIYKFILIPTGTQYLQTIVFILVIVEALNRRNLNDLTNVTKEYGILEGVVNGFATAFGFFIAITIMAGIREKIEYNDIPKPFKGTAIVLITACLMSIAFMGFSGMI